MSARVPFSDAEIRRLERFAGYGNPAAKLWFLGIEEGGGGAKDLRRRLQFRQIEDNLRAHVKILGLTDFHEEPRTIQRTWRGMCMLALALEGSLPEVDSIRAYQAEKLGRTRGSTFLTELYPIPKRRVRYWPYRALIPCYRTEEQYRKAIRDKRIDLLRKLLKRHPRRGRLIIAYGKTCWREFRQVFPERRFDARGKFEVSVGKSFTIILTPHFAAWQMNSGIRDLIKLALRLRS